MKKFIYCFLALLICFLPITANADEKNFSITGLNIHCDIEPNGDLSVQEELTYDFKGSYNGIYVNLTDDTSHKYEVSEVQVKNGDTYSSLKKSTDSENNSYQLITSDNKTQVKIFSKSSNETKAFLVKYKIKGACKKFDDYSELYWNFFNVTDNKTVGNAILTVSLKDNKFDMNTLKYWAYVNGDFTTENSDTIIKLYGKNLSEKLGVKVHFQKDFLNIPLSSNSEKSNEPSNSKDKKGDLIGILAIALTLGGLTGACIYSSKKRKRLFDEEVKMYRRYFAFFSEDMLTTLPSDLSPALVSLLYNEKLNNPSIVPATLFYLAKKGYYSLQQNKSGDLLETIFIRNYPKAEPSSIHLKSIMEWFSIYEVDGHFSFNDIKDVVSDKKVASTFRTKYLCFLSDVRLDASKLNFYTKIRDKEILSNEAHNEKLKWLAYRKYLSSKETLDTINKNEINNELIYKTALEIPMEELANASLINNEVSVNYTGNYSDYYTYFYFMNMSIFDDIDNETNKNSPNTSQFNNGDSTNFGGFSDSSGFSGGGGSDSGAF